MDFLEPRRGITALSGRHGVGHGIFPIGELEAEGAQAVDLNSSDETNASGAGRAVERSATLVGDD